MENSRKTLEAELPGETPPGECVLRQNSDPMFEPIEIMERISIVHQRAIKHLYSEVAVLKTYLQSKNVPARAIAQLDDLCETEEQRWQIVIHAVDSFL